MNYSSNPYIRAMYAKMYKMSTGKYADSKSSLIDNYVGEKKHAQNGNDNVQRILQKVLKTD